MADEYRGMQDVTGPSGKFFAVTPNDSTDFDFVPRGVYVGSTGNLVCVDSDGNEVTFVSLAIGVPHPIRPVRIKATGTSVTGIVALR